MSVMSWVKEKSELIETKIKALSSKMKTVLLVLLSIMVIGGTVGAYFIYDYTQNNPNSCVVACHLMQPAFDSWALSVHKQLNCHDCHHLSLLEQNMLLISFIVKQTKTVPARHGSTIVASKYCIECHVKGNEKRGKAPMIKDSPYHTRHIAAKIECTQCHGEVGPDKQGVHRFLPTEKFCAKCHKEKEVHGNGMGNLACLNCHTDRTTNLKPGRKKCLFCHSTDDSIRKQLVEDGTMDVKNFTPDAAIIKKATKIVYNEKSPMQFYCYECHKPHIAGKVKPKMEDCIRCHEKIRGIGKHETHLGMDMKCTDCHKKHVWKVTDASARKDCVKCHEYRSPKAFLLK